MTAKRFSQLDEITTLTGNEEIPVAYQGNNFKFKVFKIKELITKNDVGLDNVDNTADLFKPISNAVQGALNGKANTVHTHELSQVNGLPAALSSKAEIDHNHAVSEITDLQITLDTKSDINHQHSLSDLPDVQTALNNKAAAAHGHNANDITGLSNLLAAKADVVHNHNAADIPDLEVTVETIIANAGGVAGQVSVDNIEW